MPINNRQRAYLKQIGIDVWLSKDNPQLYQAPQLRDKKSHINEEISLSDSDTFVESLKNTLDVQSETALKTQSEVTLENESYVTSKTSSETKSKTNKPTKSDTSPPTSTESITKLSIDSDDFEALQAKAMQCEACSLSKTRQSVVFGEGNTQAPKLFVIGGQLSNIDEAKGQPFQGEAGELLNNMLAAIQVDTKDCYFTNILKCRTLGSELPNDSQCLTCKQYLVRQIELLQPKAILTLGELASQILLFTNNNNDVENNEPLIRIRNKPHVYESNHSDHQGVKIPVVASYHPTRLLDNTVDKAKAWDDLKRLHTILSDKF